MGVMKFRLPSSDLAQRLPDYRKAYITGLDRTPGRVGVELRNGLMTCVRDTTESGRGNSRGLGDECLLSNRLRNDRAHGYCILAHFRHGSV